MHSSTTVQTVADWLRCAAEKNGGRQALADANHVGITYDELLAQTSQRVAALRAAGLHRRCVIAVALPDGPAALVIILAAMSVGTVMPVNWRDPEDELEPLLKHADAVVVGEGGGQSAAKLAQSMGKVVFRLTGNLDACVDHDLNLVTDARHTDSPDQQPTQLDDDAIWVATSGATGAAKLIALTHESLYRSIDYAAKWMEVTERDRALCVMPFAHLHSLIRSTLPALLRGAEVVCTPGFDPLKMPSWIDEIEPTYFTAVPSIYRGLIKRSEATGWRPTGTRLRLLITGSDEIDMATAELTESLLAAPLKQFYGLSEVTPLIAITPESMTQCPEGAVGQINAAWEVVCLDDACQPLAVGSEGQIAVRGGIINRTVGATRDERLKDGWFVTGDVGRVDADGYLYFAGRADSRINRAGKKIVAQQVEQVFSEHEAIQQVVVFPVPDAEYGQKVGAAFVLREGAEIDRQQLIRFAGARLADYKLPEYVLAVDAIPLSAAGKIQRSQLATMFDLPPTQCSDKPKWVEGEVGADAVFGIDEYTSAVRTVTHMFRELFMRREIGRHDDFFELGGNSLTALNLLSMLATTTGRQMSVPDLLSNPTPSGIAALLEDAGWHPSRSNLLPLQREGDRPPLFGIPGIWGFPLAFSRLADKVATQGHPTYAMETPVGNTVEEMAAICLQDMRDACPGPYYLVGYSFGGLIALDMIRQAKDVGDIEHLFLLDPALFREKPTLRSFVRSVRSELRELRDRIRKRGNEQLPRDREQQIARNVRARDQYERPSVNVPTTMLVTEERSQVEGYIAGWNSLVGDDYRAIVLGVGHTMLDPPHIDAVGQAIVDRLLEIV